MSYILDPAKIPVVINNRNRLTTLKEMLARLELAGIQRIIILDNDSSYEPLLQYYRNTPHEVRYLGKNLGFVALWDSPLFDEIRKDYFVYSDPDIVPTPECPNDFMSVFFEELQRYKDLDKVGFSLLIDDLPDASPIKEQVIAFEEQYWKQRLGGRLYRAPIDTTFAMYRPGRRGGFWLKAARTCKPYSARHMPWYIDPKNASEEELYYRRHADASSYWTERIF